MKNKKMRCRRCARCCGYICIEIDAPGSRVDFEDMAWLLAHKKVSIRVEGKEWYLLVENPCIYLDRGGSCKIYERRPRICRRYLPGVCDFKTKPGQKDDTADHIFWKIDELYKFRDEHFPRKRKVVKKKRKIVRKKRG